MGASPGLPSKVLGPWQPPSGNRERARASESNETTTKREKKKKAYMKLATLIVAMCMLGYLAAPGHALAHPMHLKGYMDKRVESLRYQGRRMLEDLPKHVSLSAHATKIKTKAACNDKME